MPCIMALVTTSTSFIKHNRLVLSNSSHWIEEIYEIAMKNISRLSLHTSVLDKQTHTHTHTIRIIVVYYKKYVPLKHSPVKPECVHQIKLSIKTCSSGTKHTHTRDWQLWFPIWTANTHFHKFTIMADRAFCYAEKEEKLGGTMC